MDFRFGFVFLVLLVSLFLFGCTDQPICGDGVCSFVEQDSSSPFYCSTDCGIDHVDCFCPKEVNPVCGVDGVTYPNSCFALCKEVKVDYLGECVDLSNCGNGVCDSFENINNCFEDCASSGADFLTEKNVYEVGEQINIQ